jgi:hypothetical protein
MTDIQPNRRLDDKLVKELVEFVAIAAAAPSEILANYCI